MQGSIKTYLTLILLALAIFCHAQDSYRPSYDLKRISSTSGISSVEITMLFQDSEGFIWLGTSTGISRYDGINFQNFMYAGEELIANINDIVQTDDGVIWAAGINGLFYFNKKEFIPTAISDKAIHSIFIDVKGDLIIGGKEFAPFKVMRNEQEQLREGKEVKFTPLIKPDQWEEQYSEKQIWDITEDDDGKIWIGLDNTLARLDGDTIVSIWTSLDDKARVSDINAINIDSVYWGGEDLGLRLKSGSKIDLIMNVYAYISTRTDTSLTFLTTKDLIRITKEGRDTLSNLEGYDNLYFRAMLEDREGNLWIASEGSLFKVTANYFQSWTSNGADLLYSNHSIAQMESGEIWIGSSKKNILVWDGKSFKVKNEIPAAYNSVTERILEDMSGNVWYATSMSGLILSSGSEYINIDEDSGLLDKTTLFMKEDRFGRLWSGGESGISQIMLVNDQVKIKNYSPDREADESIKFVNVICKSEDECYAISNKAIYKIGSKNMKQIDILFGDEQAIISNAIIDRRGGFLVSTLGKGILQIKLNSDEVFELVNTWNQENGLLSDIVLNLHIDNRNRIWTFSQNGACVISGLENNDEIRCFDQRDGWVPLATTHVDLLESKDDMMWVVANSTITRFPLYNMPVNEVSPQTFISKVQLFEGREDVEEYRVEYSESNQNKSRLDLPHDKNFLEFSFVSTSFTHNEKNQFSYQLEGLDESWSRASSSTSASYPGLKPGKYIFKVLAINNSGIRGEIPATLPFRVFSPWYLKWWALLLYFIAAASIIYTFYRLQLNKKRKEDEANKLKELNEFQSNFYTNITHEFRTPLTVILGITEKLSSEFNKEHFLETRNDLEMIERNANNLLKLVNEMLDMSMLENGSLQLHLIQADVCTFIKYILESLRSLASLKKVDLVCYNEEQNLIMDYDEEKLGAIISNLVSNAIKFSSAGDQIIVHLKSERKEGRNFLVIKVKDEGLGIEEKDLPHIFERFYTSKDDTSLDGVSSGVGLALSKEFVALMSGKISVKSKLGYGSEFQVTLPITNNAPFSKQAGQNAITPMFVKSLPPQLKKGPIKIEEHREIALIIEDNADVATYLTGCLDAKYQTIHAEDGEEGIAMAIEHQPDIVISDVMMPKKNGFEVCEHLKNDGRTDHIPIILLTARADRKDRLSGFSHGADAYLTKPFSKPELFTRIDQLIMGRKKLLDKLSKSGIDAFMRKKMVDPDALFIQKAIKVIQENMDNAIFGPPLLAKKLRLSESQVYRKLKSISGKSTALFIRSIRLQKAKDLIQEPEMNISEVAYEVGFTNPSWFSTAFKEEFGFSPSDLK